MHHGAMTPSLGSRILGFSPSGSALGPQLYYGEETPPMVPPQVMF